VGSPLVYYCSIRNMNKCEPDFYLALTDPILSRDLDALGILPAGKDELYQLCSHIIILAAMSSNVGRQS
jgi:hypothetical protein